VAAKDRLYRALDKALEYKAALETHLGQRWRDLFGARCDLLLYDLTSTYFEGHAGEAPKAAFGYSRDHRPDCRQLILALVVTEEGFPLSYEVFEGNRADVSTFEEILDSVERKHGSLGRVWVLDRGIVSEENLELLRRRGAGYLVVTPRRKLAAFEQDLLKADWAEVAGRPGIEVKLVEREGELYVLSRFRERVERERTLRLRALHGLRNDLRELSKAVRTGRLCKRDLILLRLGRLEECWPNAWPYLKRVELTDAELIWRWDRKKMRSACLLRTNFTRQDSQKLWRQYLQLTEVEVVFRTLKSELNLRPIWHRLQRRVEAPSCVAFLGYCVWVCLTHLKHHEFVSSSPRKGYKSAKTLWHYISPYAAEAATSRKVGGAAAPAARKAAEASPLS
jgi:hypothetical protein